MILVDDNFATIVKSVEEGRRVYSNIRKSLYAMLGCNLSALMIVLISLVIGWGAPVQLLIIKVVADGILGFSLSVEPADQKIMEQSPVPKTTSIFAHGLLNKIVEISFIFTIATLAASLIGFAQSNEISRTMTFIVLGLSTITHMYNCRSKKSIFNIQFLGNRLLVSTTLISALIIVLLVSLPVTQQIFGFTNISTINWFWSIALSLVTLVYIELKKFFKLH